MPTIHTASFSTLRLLEMSKYYGENSLVGCHFCGNRFMRHVDLVVGANAIRSGHISCEGLEGCYS